MPIRRHVRGTTRPNEVEILVLHDTLVDPPSSNGARAFLSQDQCALRFLGRAEEPAELFVFGVLIERRELVQVQERLVPDILDGMDVDLE